MLRGLWEAIKMANCERLDRIGHSMVEAYGVQPYEVNVKITASADCSKARTYYTEVMGIDLTDYRMHHTMNRTIVPVHKDFHKVPHSGGVKMLGLKR